MTQIYHPHLYGTRDSKYDWLQTHDVLSTDWQELKPQAPFYLLIPQNTDLLSEYDQGWKMTDVMPVHVYGFKSHRDNYAISFEKKEIQKRVTDLIDAESNNEDFSEKYKLGDWNWESASKALRNDPDI